MDRSQVDCLKGVAVAYDDAEPDSFDMFDIERKSTAGGRWYREDQCA